MIILETLARRHARQALAIGLVLGLGIGVTAIMAWRRVPPPPDPAMERACTMPHGEGEMTVAVIQKGARRLALALAVARAKPRVNLSF